MEQSLFRPTTPFRILDSKRIRGCQLEEYLLAGWKHFSTIESKYLENENPSVSHLVALVKDEA